MSKIGAGLYKISYLYGGLDIRSHYVHMQSESAQSSKLTILGLRHFEELRNLTSKLEVSWRLKVENLTNTFILFSQEGGN